MACAALEAAEAEAGATKLARLGFAFDQKVHDAAVAEDQARAEARRQEILRPGADVLVLERYEVNEDRVPLKEQQVLTAKGRLELAKQRYTSPLYRKTLGPLVAVAGLLANPLGGWNPNGAEAMVLYEQDEQVRRNREMADLAELQELQDLTDVPPAKPKGKK